MLTNRRHFLGVLCAVPLLGAKAITLNRAREGRSVAYIACSDASSVAVVDVASGMLITTIAVGASPSRMLADVAGGRLFVSNFGANTISVIDMRKRLVTAAFATEQGPSMLALDPVRQRLYVCNVISNSVMVIDAASGSVLARTACGAHPNGLALDVLRNEAFVVGREPGIMNVLGWNGNALSSTAAKIAGAVDSIESAAGGTQGFTCDALHGTLSTIDYGTRSVTAVVGGLSTPESFAVSDDDPQRVYVAERASSTVAIVDLKGSAVIGRIPTAAAPYAIRWDTASKRLFVVDFEGDAVTIVDPATRSATATLRGFSKPRDIVIAGG